METDSEKRWHRAFSVERRLKLIETARSHPAADEFPGKIMFDTIKQLAEICDEQEQQLTDLEALAARLGAQVDQHIARIIELENRKVFDDFDEEAYSDS